MTAIRFELERAIVENQLVLHYQPRVLVETKKVRGVEALLRWHNPQRGLVSPLDFIPIAEREGLIRDIEAWVVREALLTSTVWHRDGIDLGVSVNVSPRALRDPQFMRLIRHALRIQRTPRAFVVEISAAGAAAEPELPHEALGELRSAGVRVALDDVTSLEQLERTRAVRWDYVKLGRAVIGAAAHDPDTAALARSLVEAVRPSGARLAAVGVEDDAALAMARDLGCYLAQGYLFAAPMPQKELFDWLRDRT